MKHIFVINPMAGPVDAHSKIEKEINELNIDNIIHVTTGPKDAIKFVKNYINKHPDEEMRFYACGGDGTVNEVVTGMVGADTSKVSLAVYPIGSGNDYIKVYGGEKRFNDLKKLISAETHLVDLMEVNDGKVGYSLNIINFGFDCNVLKVMEKIKRNKNTTKEKAYTKAVFSCLIGSRKNPGKLICDDEVLCDDKFLLCSIANGQYYGSQFNPAPYSVNDDGLMDVCIFRPVSVLTFLMLIGIYKKGKHLENKWASKLLKYRRTGGLIEIEGPEGFCISLDGELHYGTHFRVKNLKHAISFVVPKE